MTEQKCPECDTATQKNRANKGKTVCEDSDEETDLKPR